MAKDKNVVSVIWAIGSSIWDHLYNVMQIWIQKSFAPLKRILPTRLANFIRSAVTAGFSPFFDYYRSGHFRSSFAMRSVDRRGRPLPWYTYPCINFLKQQSFTNRNCLEFGAGQSTGLPPEKWSSLKYGLWPDGGLRNAEEETQGGRDCREAATG
jgi:hypothetical protein